jgi:hypothetical protein
MGEAKRRGVFEQRRAAAKKRNAEIAREQRLAEITRRQTTTPEEKQRKKQVNTFLIITSRLIAGTMMPYRMYPGAPPDRQGGD